MPDTDQNYPVHKETFDVVLLKKGVNPMNATPADFKRVSVVASSPLEAQMSEGISNEKDHNVLFAVTPGVQSDPEVMARRRELEGKDICRSCLNTPCTCRKG